MKPIKCELWIGTKTGASICLGKFDSISAAKQYARECVTCNYYIVRIK